MVFSTNLFIFLFLPLFLTAYLVLDFIIDKLKRKKTNSKTWINLLLLLFSLFFYFWGSGLFILVFCFSIFFNFLSGKLIYKNIKPKLVLISGIIINLSILFFFKYSNFFYDQVSNISSFLFNIKLIEIRKIFLPIGISFYTFMAISYLVDIYNTKEKNSSLLSFGTFLTLFPHLVAGPIVRYNEIKYEIQTRQFNSEVFFEGIWRFCIGLGKKVIIANNMGSVADKIFNLQNNELTFALSWIGIVCYTLQIYFDFSGYSDMAIGLARFFGFHFPENFNLPYISKNVTEFWQRWHMSLSRWFRDYLYIPLGGNRKGRIKTYFNLFIVFFLCGLWHGASWTFVVWGMYHGIILVIEKILKNNYKFEMKGIIGNILTFVLIMIGWVFFRSTTISGAFHYLTVMFSFNTLLVNPNSYYSILYYLSHSTIFYIIIGLFFLSLLSLHLKLVPLKKITSE